MQVNPKGSEESSRWSERSADHRITSWWSFAPRRGARRLARPRRAHLPGDDPVVSASLRSPATIC